jgi:hypothetical protein
MAMAAWGDRWDGRVKAALALSLLSPFLPPLAAVTVAALALAVQPKGAQRWGAPVAAVLLALLRLRMAYLPVFSGDMAFWGGLLALVGVMAASQQLLAALDGEAAGRALARGQVAWVLFGILSPAPLGWSGALLLLWQQALLRQPLARVLEQAPGRVVLAGGLFLGLAGGPPLGAFNAYFQLLAPLMTESATVATMQAKLFTGTGLLAVLAILALLYQTGAFGYFYWARVLPAAPEAGSGSRPLPQPWAWYCLGLSLVWGVAEHWGGPGRLALHALQAVGAIPNS